MTVQGIYVGDNMADWGYDPSAPGITGRTWTGTGTLWNGPICPTCGKGYIGTCQQDHGPYVDFGYIGRHRP
jgi:hypothetical protein